MNHQVAPTAIDDVLHYLVARGRPDLPPGAYDITGPDTIPYRQLFQKYIRAARLHGLLLPVPRVPTKLAGAVIGKITPLQNELAADLIESMHKHRDRRQHGHPVAGSGPARRTHRRRRRNKPGAARDRNRTRRSPGHQKHPDPLRLASTDPKWAGGDRDETHQERQVDAPADQVWSMIETVGGTIGFLSWPLAWKLRAQLDRWAGGPRRRQQRAHPGQLTAGDTVEFLTRGRGRAGSLLAICHRPVVTRKRVAGNLG